MMMKSKSRVFKKYKEFGSLNFYKTWQSIIRSLSNLEGDQISSCGWFWSLLVAASGDLQS